MAFSSLVDRWMLVSDLDGTLLGDHAATMRFREWWTPWARHAQLVYASGRRYDAILDSIREHSLPTPDAVVADVGTDVRLYATGVPFAAWTSLWRSSWRMEAVCKVFDHRPDLVLQPDHCQTPFKRSYFVRNPKPGWFYEARYQLRRQNIQAELIFSSNRDLDVLPAGVNKGAAVEFLARTNRISPNRVLVAGDSGNDLSMFVKGFMGIVVGNAQPEIASLTSRNVYRSSSAYADGIIDGAEHWLRRGFLRQSVK